MGLRLALATRTPQGSDALGSESDLFPTALHLLQALLLCISASLRLWALIQVQPPHHPFLCTLTHSAPASMGQMP